MQHYVFQDGKSVFKFAVSNMADGAAKIMENNGLTHDDVSWLVPTVGFSTATWVPGTPAHSWQAVAAGGMSIGHKGMHLAAQLIGETALDLLNQPETIAAAKAELKASQGEGFVYAALLGDRDPPLDYRN